MSTAKKYELINILIDDGKVVRRANCNLEFTELDEAIYYLNGRYGATPEAWSLVWNQFLPKTTLTIKRDGWGKCPGVTATWQEVVVPLKAVTPKDTFSLRVVPEHLEDAILPQPKPASKKSKIERLLAALRA